MKPISSFFGAKIGAAILAGVLLTVSLAKATTYTISVVNISGFTGPYAQAVVNLTDSTHATISFTSLVNGGDIYLLGGAGAVAVNVNAATWTLGPISGSNSGTGFTPGSWSSGGLGNEDGFGSFNQTINSFDGYTHSSDTISFTLTDLTGAWASSSDVLTANANGYFVAAHIFATASPANASNGAINTGFAVDGPSSSAPDGGATVALLGLGLLGTFGLRRRLVRS